MIKNSLDSSLEITDDKFDDKADEIICSCLDINNPKSFFMLAGAGSGKTRSLEKAIRFIEYRFGDILSLRGQQIGVITFTKKARDEIKSRLVLKNNDIAFVSTIHAFVWNLIKGFNDDIREFLRGDIKESIDKLELTNPRIEERIKKKEKDLIRKREQLANLDKIGKFTYNPDSNTLDNLSLNHDQVLKLGQYFLLNKELMREILIRKFPFLLIDESQDTEKGLMSAFIDVQKKNQTAFSLGLFGDMMQQIYLAGAKDLETLIPANWERPEKVMNHRSRERIVKLINKIRENTDGFQQRPRKDKKDGLVRVFIAKSDANKIEFENLARAKMATESKDNDWNDSKKVTSLILEHRMAANRMGFIDMFEALSEHDGLKMGLTDGSISETKVFSENVLPIFKAYDKNNMFEIMNIVREKSKFFNKSEMRKLEGRASEEIGNIKKNIEDLYSAYNTNKNISFKKILEIVAKGNIFEFSNNYNDILKNSGFLIGNTGVEEIDDKKTEVLESFLTTKFSQIEEYANYINESSWFYTHHGVKGLEFPRVMIMIDDTEARGFSYSYEAFFGIKTGSDSVVSNTQKVFYVICSRAQESLAIMIYTDNPIELKNQLITKNLFIEEEIELLN